MPGLTFVTGANGFIGGHFQEWWRARGWPLRIATRSTLANPQELATSLQGVQNVVHLAGRVHIMRENARDPLGEFRRVNVGLTRQLCEAAATAGVQRFIYASSIKAVGESNEAAWTEETAANPTDPYGVSKLEGESAVAAIAAQHGMGSAALRLPLVYGPGVRANFLRMIMAIDRGWPLPLGAVHNRRSLLAIENALSAIEHLVATSLQPAEVFLVSDDHDLSTTELLREVARALDRRPRLLRVPLHWVPQRLRPSALSRLLGSLTVSPARLRARTGWRPVVTPAEGITRTVRWYRSHPTVEARSS